MRDYYQNPYMGIFFNMPEDKLVETVAENFFAKADSPLLNVLNSNFVEGCVDDFIQNQTVELDLDDLPENQDGWTKPSRKDRRKHDKKASKRKGNAKRFRDRSRKWASWRHMEKVYDRGLAGDWGRRGRRLEEAGQVACKTNYRVKTNCADFIPDDNDTNDVTMTFGDVSMTMNQFNWKDYEEQWDAFCNAYAFHELRDNNDYSLWDEYWKQFESDEFIEIEDDFDFESDEDKIEDNDYIPDTPDTQFSAIEMADIVNQIAYATPDECVKIREFFKNL